MAGNASDRCCCLARRLAITTQAQYRFLGVSYQQCSLGGVGLARQRLGVDCSSVLLGHTQYPRREEDRRGGGGKHLRLPASEARDLHRGWLCGLLAGYERIPEK